jgi:hypothetical protein
LAPSDPYNFSKNKLGRSKIKNSKDITKTVAIIIVLAIILTVFFIFNKKTQDNAKVKSGILQDMVLPKEDKTYNGQAVAQKTICNSQLVDQKTIDQKQMELIGPISMKGDIYTAYREKCETDCKFYIAKGDGFEKILCLDYKVPDGKIRKDKIEDNKLEFVIESKNPPRGEGSSGAVIIFIQAIIWKKDMTGLFITFITVPSAEGLPVSEYYAIGSKDDSLELLWCDNSYYMAGEQFEAAIDESIKFNKDIEATQITFKLTKRNDAGKKVTTNYVLKWDDMQNKLILSK